MWPSIASSFLFQFFILLQPGRQCWMNSSCSNVYVLPVFYLANLRQENDKKNVLRRDSNFGECNICHCLSKTEFVSARPAITGSKLTIETLEEGVKYVQI